MYKFLILINLFLELAKRVNTDHLIEYHWQYDAIIMTKELVLYNVEFLYFFNVYHSTDFVDLYSPVQNVPVLCWLLLHGCQIW